MYIKYIPYWDKTFSNLPDIETQAMYVCKRNLFVRINGCNCIIAGLNYSHKLTFDIQDVVNGGKVNFPKIDSISLVRQEQILEHGDILYLDGVKNVVNIWENKLQIIPFMDTFLIRTEELSLRYVNDTLKTTFKTIK